MIDKKFIRQLKKQYDKREGERRRIISASNSVLHDSKRAIFSLHREDVEKAEKDLAEIENNIARLEKEFGAIRLNAEGSYRAAVEEFVEAKTFLLAVQGKKITEFEGVNLEFDAYLGGLCDLTGELVRRGVNQAAQGNLDEVGKMKIFINEIMQELVNFDMTGYLRTKYDQAKSSLRKIEQIDYEIRIRNK